MRSPVIGVLAALYLDPAAAQELKLVRTAVTGTDSLLAHEHACDRNCNALETKITDPGFQGMNAVSNVVVYPNGNRSPTSITINVN